MGNVCVGNSKECKGCGMTSNKTMGKVEKDGYHLRCRVCSLCNKRFYYLNDAPFYIRVETGTHFPTCPPEVSPYSDATLTAFYSPYEPDIR